MKLSEAMMLGSLVIEFNPHLFLACGEGCLRGAAFYAATGKNFMCGHEDAEVWPWLATKMLPPPGTRYSKDGPSEARHIINAIAWAVECGDWTIEQAVDWVRSVEPAEPPSSPVAQEERDRVEVCP
jgi:hypothetical protein